jgi:hypothetical protein
MDDPLDLSGMNDEVKCPISNKLRDLAGSRDGKSKGADGPPHPSHQGNAATGLDVTDPEEGLRDDHHPGHLR